MTLTTEDEDDLVSEAHLLDIVKRMKKDLRADVIRKRKTKKPRRNRR